MKNKYVRCHEACLLRRVFTRGLCFFLSVSTTFLTCYPPAFCAPGSVRSVEQATLSPASFTETPRTNRALRAAMYRTNNRLWEVDAQEHLSLLQQYGAGALYLPAGKKFLVSTETAGDDKALLRALVHEEYYVLLEQRRLEWERDPDGTRYDAYLTELGALLGDSELLDLHRAISLQVRPIDRWEHALSDLLATAFTLSFMIEERLIDPQTELTPDEQRFLSGAQPFIAGEGAGALTAGLFDDAFFDQTKRWAVLEGTVWRPDGYGASAVATTTLRTAAERAAGARPHGWNAGALIGTELTGIRGHTYRIDWVLTDHDQDSIFMAQDTATGRPAVIKLVSGMHEEYQDIEAAALTRLRARGCTFVPEVYDRGQFQTYHWTAMEMVKGIPLDLWAQRRMAGGSYKQLDEVFACFRQVVGLFARIHATGIQHRDIKPEHIVVAPDGTITILDFETAYVPGVSNREVIDLPVTRAYGPPERLVLGLVSDSTPAYDVFQLGVVLFELVTGKPVPVDREIGTQTTVDLSPQEEADEHEQIFAFAGSKRAVRNGLPRPVRFLGPVIARATAQKVKKRFQDAQAFEQALKSLSSVVDRAARKERERGAATAGESSETVRAHIDDSLQALRDRAERAHWMSEAASVMTGQVSTVRLVPTDLTGPFRVHPSVSQVDERRVRQLMKRIREGRIEALDTRTVRVDIKTDGLGPYLDVYDGRHRLEAFRRLGITAVPGQVVYAKTALVEAVPFVRIPGAPDDLSRYGAREPAVSVGGESAETAGVQELDLVAGMRELSRQVRGLLDEGSPVVVVITGKIRSGKTTIADEMRKGFAGLSPRDILVVHHDLIQNRSDDERDRQELFNRLIGQRAAGKRLVVIEGFFAPEDIGEGSVIPEADIALRVVVSPLVHEERARHFHDAIGLLQYQAIVEGATGEPAAVPARSLITIRNDEDLAGIVRSISRIARGFLPENIVTFSDGTRCRIRGDTPDGRCDAIDLSAGIPVVLDPFPAGRGIVARMLNRIDPGRWQGRVVTDQTGQPVVIAPGERGASMEEAGAADEQSVSLGDAAIRVPAGYGIIPHDPVLDRDGNYEEQFAYLRTQVEQVYAAGKVPLLATMLHNPSLPFIKAIESVRGTRPQTVSFDRHSDAYLSPVDADDVPLFSDPYFWRYGITERLITGTDLVYANQNELNYLRGFRQCNVTEDDLTALARGIPDASFVSEERLEADPRYQAFCAARLAAAPFPSVAADTLYLLHHGVAICGSLVAPEVLDRSRPLVISYDTDISFTAKQLAGNGALLAGRDIAGIHIAEPPLPGFSPAAVTEFLERLAPQAAPAGESTEVLQYFELYFNSGRGHLSYDEAGEQIVEESPEAFTPEEKRPIVRALWAGALASFSEAASADFDGLAAQVASWDETTIDAFLSEPEPFCRAVSALLGGGVSFNDKSSELEIVLSPDAQRRVAGMNRAQYRQRVADALEPALRAFEHRNAQVFAGVEYCKVTIFDKADTAIRILADIGGGTIIGLGDSAVDISFLALQPVGMDYRGYYLGEQADVAGYPSVRVSDQPNVEGAYNILRVAIEACEQGMLDLRAIIADIDNSVATYPQDLEPRMVDLFHRALHKGVRVYLITGGHLEHGYYERVVHLLENPLIAMEYAAAHVTGRLSAVLDGLSGRTITDDRGAAYVLAVEHERTRWPGATVIARASDGRDAAWLSLGLDERARTVEQRMVVVDLPYKERNIQRNLLRMVAEAMPPGTAWEIDYELMPTGKRTMRTIINELTIEEAGYQSAVLYYPTAEATDDGQTLRLVKTEGARTAVHHRDFSSFYAAELDVCRPFVAQLGITPESRVLDVGAWWGSFPAPALLAAEAGARVRVIDILPRSVAAAAQKVKGRYPEEYARVAGRLSYECANLLSTTDCPPDSADYTLLFNIPDEQDSDADEMIIRALDTTVNGGTIVISMIYPGERPLRRFERIAREEGIALERLRDREGDFGHPLSTHAYVYRITKPAEPIVGTGPRDREVTLPPSDTELANDLLLRVQRTVYDAMRAVGAATVIVRTGGSLSLLPGVAGFRMSDVGDVDLCVHCPLRETPENCARFAAEFVRAAGRYGLSAVSTGGEGVRILFGGQQFSLEYRIADLGMASVSEPWDAYYGDIRYLDQENLRRAVSQKYDLLVGEIRYVLANHGYDDGPSGRPVKIFKKCAELARLFGEDVRAGELLREYQRYTDDGSLPLSFAEASAVLSETVQLLRPKRDQWDRYPPERIRAVPAPPHGESVESFDAMTGLLRSAAFAVKNRDAQAFAQASTSIEQTGAAVWRLPHASTAEYIQAHLVPISEYLDRLQARFPGAAGRIGAVRGVALETALNCMEWGGEGGVLALRPVVINGILVRIELDAMDTGPGIRDLPARYAQSVAAHEEERENGLGLFYILGKPYTDHALIETGLRRYQAVDDEASGTRRLVETGPGTVQYGLRFGLAWDCAGREQGASAEVPGAMQVGASFAQALDPDDPLRADLEQIWSSLTDRQIPRARQDLLTLLSKADGQILNTDLVRGMRVHPQYWWETEDDLDRLWPVASLIGASRAAGTVLPSELTVHRVGDIVAEIIRNQWMHADYGLVLTRPLERDGRLGVRLIALDSGEGMADPRGAKERGMSSKGPLFLDGTAHFGGFGQGLRHIEEYADRFTIGSVPGRGTWLVVDCFQRPEEALVPADGDHREDADQAGSERGATQETVVVLRTEQEPYRMMPLEVTAAADLSASRMQQAAAGLERWFDDATVPVEHRRHIERYIELLRSGERDALTFLYLVFSPAGSEVEGYLDLNLENEFSPGFFYGVIEIAPWNRIETERAGGIRRYRGLGAELRAFGLRRAIALFGESVFDEENIGRLLTMGFRNAGREDIFDYEDISRADVERYLAEQDARREELVATYGMAATTGEDVTAVSLAAGESSESVITDVTDWTPYLPILDRLIDASQNALPGNPLVGLTVEELAYMALRGRPVTITEWRQSDGNGKTIFRERDPGREVYILFDGTLSVEGETVPVGTSISGAGTVFGEMADGGPRTATVRVQNGPVTLFVLNRRDFLLMRINLPKFNRAIERIIAARNRQNEVTVAERIKTIAPKIARLVSDRERMKQRLAAQASLAELRRTVIEAVEHLMSWGEDWQILEYLFSRRSYRPGEQSLHLASGPSALPIAEGFMQEVWINDLDEHELAMPRMLARSLGLDGVHFVTDDIRRLDPLVYEGFPARFAHITMVDLFGGDAYLRGLPSGPIKQAIMFDDRYSPRDRDLVDRLIQQEAAVFAYEVLGKMLDLADDGGDILLTVDSPRTSVRNDILGMLDRAAAEKGVRVRKDPQELISAHDSRVVFLTVERVMAPVPADGQKGESVETSVPMPLTMEEAVRRMAPLSGALGTDLEDSAALARELVREEVSRVVVVGTGLINLPVLLALCGKEVTFIDADPAVARSTRWKIQRLNAIFGRDLPLRVIGAEFGGLDRNAYGLSSGGFDAVTMVDLVGGLPRGDLRQCLRQAKELLRPGGYLVLDDDASVAETFSRYADEVIPDRQLMADGRPFRGTWKKQRPANHLYRLAVPAEGRDDLDRCIAQVRAAQDAVALDTALTALCAYLSVPALEADTVAYRSALARTLTGLGEGEALNETVRRLLDGSAGAQDRGRLLRETGANVTPLTNEFGRAERYAVTLTTVPALPAGAVSTAVSRRGVDRARAQEAVDELNRVLRRSELNASVTAFGLACDEMPAAARFTCAIPYEVLMNAPDIALTFEKIRALTARGIAFELVVSEVPDELLSGISALSEDELVREVLAIPAGCAVRLVSAGEIRALAKSEHPGPVERMDALHQVLTEGRPVPAGQYIAIVQEPAAQGQFSLSQILTGWFDEIRSGEASAVSVILPDALPRNDDLDERLRNMWEVLIAA